MHEFPAKDPDAVLDIQFDWRLWLASGETITGRTITLTGSAAKDSDSESNGFVTVWLSGGDEGDRCTVACRIMTSAGRTDERTAGFWVRTR